MKRRVAYLLLLEGESPGLGERQKAQIILVSIWLLHQHVMACRYLDGLFYSGTNVSRLMFDKSVMYAKSP